MKRRASDPRSRRLREFRKKLRGRRIERALAGELKIILPEEAVEERKRDVNLRRQHDRSDEAK